MNQRSDAYEVQTNVNGRLGGANEPTLTSLNRGFLYGDSIYEVWRTYDEVVFAWKPHLDRLHRSGNSIHLLIPWSADFLFSEIQKTATAFRANFPSANDLYIRLQIYRGEGPIGLSPRLADKPGYIIWVRALSESADDFPADGRHLIIARSVQRNPVEALNPAWKTGNYLNNIVGLHEAEQRGADDVVFLNRAGELTEASTSNVAFIDQCRVVTPPVSAGILPGITRSEVLQHVAARAGLEVEERTIQPADLDQFQEAFLLSTTKDIQPVAKIDAYQFTTGPTSHSFKLKKAFWEHASDYAEVHPKQKL